MQVWVFGGMIKDGVTNDNFADADVNEILVYDIQSDKWRIEVSSLHNSLISLERTSQQYIISLDRYSSRRVCR
jgi:hypothetical protein